MLFLRNDYAHVLDAERKLNRELRPLLKVKSFLEEALKEPLYDSLSMLATTPITHLLATKTSERVRGHYWAGNTQRFK